MIRIMIQDTETGNQRVITRSKENLANDPMSRISFSNWYNIKIAGFINEALGKTKKTMKDLDKEV